MRTTLSIDDDVLLAVQERARRERRSVGAVLSELARQALNRPRHSERVAEDEFLGFRPMPSRGVTVSNDLIDRLRDEEGV
jgi:hypothetical protein